MEHAASGPGGLSDKISALRNFSRQLVRELGYLRSPVAGTDLTPSAVHAILEVGMQPGILARDLAQALRLDKSNTSRQLSKLEALGLLRREAVQADARSYALYLTEAGQVLYQEADDFGSRQVAKVLEQLDEREQQALGRYLSLYADALSRTGLHQAAQASPTRHVRSGYRAGCQGGITALVARDLLAGLAPAQAAAAEATLAQALGAFLATLDQPGKQLWLYCEDEQVLGAIALDGDVQARTARLAWFIVHPTLRGTGVGRLLLETALDEGRRCFDRIEGRLATAPGMDMAAARALYETQGLQPGAPEAGTLWGVPVQLTAFSWQR